MKNFSHGKGFMLGIVQRLGMKRSSDTEIFLILQSVYGRRGLITLALQPNCTFYFDLWPHCDNDKPYIC